MDDNRKGLEGYTRYALCCFCGQIKLDHAGPKFQCLFASTYFKNLSKYTSPKEYTEWERRSMR